MTVQDKINTLFKELVPYEGKADTVAGEIVRAVCRIGYRYLNDGDNIAIEYGNETCNFAARYLIENTNEKIADYIYDEMWGAFYNTSQIDHLCELVIEYINENPSLKTEKNDIDMQDYFDEYTDTEYLSDYEEEEYDTCYLF